MNRAYGGWVSPLLAPPTALCSIPRPLGDEAKGDGEVIQMRVMRKKIFISVLGSGLSSTDIRVKEKALVGRNFAATLPKALF